MLREDENIINEENKCFAIVFAIILVGNRFTLYSDFFSPAIETALLFQIRSFLREILCWTKVCEICNAKLRRFSASPKMAELR